MMYIGKRSCRDNPYFITDVVSPLFGFTSNLISALVEVILKAGVEDRSQVTVGLVTAKVVKLFTSDSVVPLELVEVIL